MRGLFAGLGACALGRAEGAARLPTSFAHLLLALLALLGANLFPVLFWPRPPEGLGGPLIWALSGFVCSALVPLALTLILALIWGRGAGWPRYAIAFTWLWTLIALLLSVLPSVLGFGVALGQQASGAGNAPFNLGLGVFYLLGLCYVLWLNWFLIRHGLAVSVVRALVGLALITIIPTFLDGMRYNTFEAPMAHTVFKN